MVSFHGFLPCLPLPRPFVTLDGEHMQDEKGSGAEADSEASLNEPSGGYGNQRQYVSKVAPLADARQKEIEQELRSAFRSYLETRPVEVIIFTIGIDIKRIEARQDIHKRCDEIVNKAAKLKSAFRRARFGAVIYYPFVQDHASVLSRLESPNIDAVVFASGSAETIENAVRLLLAKVEEKEV
jgi:hypothetical protein